MEPYRTSSGVLVRPRPVTSRYGGPGDTPAKRRAARQQRRLRAYRIVQTIPHIPKGSRVLDVGCGDGELFRWLGSRLGLGMGIDPLLPGSIVGARYRLTRGWFPEDLPDVGSFDVVTMLAVLEEVPVEGRAWLVAACTRRLGPGGRLIFTAPPEVADHLPMAAATRVVAGPEDLYVFVVDGPSMSGPSISGPDRMR
jgi:2-polyprenyl-3-methyl-5-hydroxy-6-metoxy-1,4-benzoquinol methylase